MNEGEEGGVVQIVLKVWSSNSHYSGGCDYAVVDGNAALMKLALRRIRALCNQKDTRFFLERDVLLGLFRAVFQSVDQSAVEVRTGPGSDASSWKNRLRRSKLTHKKLWSFRMILVCQKVRSERWSARR